jgi:protein TonB
MNANRNLTWGIVLSLFTHGALLGLPLSPGGPRTTISSNPTPLEISLVMVKSLEDAPAQVKPIPVTHLDRVGPSVAIRRKKPPRRSAPLTQIPRARRIARPTEKKITEKRQKPIAFHKGKTALATKPEPFTLFPRGKSTAIAPQLEKKRTPLPSVRNLSGRRRLRASRIPKGAAPAPSGAIPWTRPRYARNPKPRYPKVARRKGCEGVVVLKIEILPNGRVGKVRIKRSCGHDILDKSALKTVKKWRFIPAKRGEDPMRIWAEIPIKFELE